MTTALAHADAAALAHTPVLAATTTRGLLDALIRLTAAIHVAPSESVADGLRVSREAVCGELLRRTGGAA